MAGRQEPTAARGATRRGLLMGGVAFGGVAAAGAGALAPAMFAPRAVRLAASDPVVGFHADRPYLDLSGQAEPYRPAVGPRGADAVAGLHGHISPRIYLI